MTIRTQGNGAGPLGRRGPPQQEPVVDENAGLEASTETSDPATSAPRLGTNREADNSNQSENALTDVDTNVGSNGPDGLENPQIASPAPIPSEVIPPSNKAAPTKVRDLKYSDIKPMVMQNRERGMKVKATAIHRSLVKRYGEEMKPQLRNTQRVVGEVNEELDKARQLNKSQNGGDQEIYFRQGYEPGEVAQLDCCSLAGLGITIQGQPFLGKLFTFKLMHSKGMYAGIVQSERALEVLPAIEDALFSFGGTPDELRSDNGKALFARPKEPTQAYADLCRHYGMSWSTSNPGRPNENGGAEAGNRTLKNRLRDLLMTEVDPNLESIGELKALLQQVLDEYNAEVEPELSEERRHLGRLPKKRVDPYEPFERTVNAEGLIAYNGCSYSVPPDLHGRGVKIKGRRYADSLVIFDHEGAPAWRRPLEADAEVRVDFRHVIHWLKRKPGAFGRLGYKDQMFPTKSYRETYENFRSWYASPDGDRDYLAILEMANGPGPIRQGYGQAIMEVDCALELLLETEKKFTASDVGHLLEISAGARSSGCSSTGLQGTFP